MDATALVPLTLALLVGLVAGVVAGIVYGRAAGSSAAAAAVAERDGLRSERDRLVAERESLLADRDDQAGRGREAELALHGLRATVEAEKVAAAQRLADVQRAQAELSERFKLLSQEALDRTTDRLVRLADDKIKASELQSAAALDQRRQAVEHLVKPLAESLSKVERQLTDVERTRTEAYADLRRQVQSMNETSAGLRVETAQLVSALRAPQVRGRWGELQLRRVVEAAGMVEHCDFVEQDRVDTEDGAVRPDLVVKLAGGKNVVVDSKVAFSGYLEAMEARADDVRAARLRAHARHLRTHIDQLGAKAYWEHFDPTPEFVVMFVPAEAFLNAALEEDPTLLEHAFDRNVVIATPSTLVALLRTVAYTWRQEALAANAAQVLELGRTLYNRLATMGGHLSKVGRQINGAVKAYNDTVSSMESRVLVTARKMVELRVADTELEPPPQVELHAREIQAAELVASRDEALVSLDEIGRDHRYGLVATAAATDDAAEDAARDGTAG